MKLKVIKPFKDKKTKELYQAGVEIESADVARINDVVARGLCQIVELDAAVPANAQGGKLSLFEQEFDREKVDAALKLTSVKGNISKFNGGTIIAKVAELSDDELKIFKEALLID